MGTSAGLRRPTRKGSLPGGRRQPQADSGAGTRVSALSGLEPGPAASAGFAQKILLLIVGLLANACGNTTVTSTQTSVDPPACTSLTQFGNGQTCGTADPTLASCGTSASRLCAGGWLCYDAPEYEQCACTTDADCVGKRAYVGQARALNNKQPVGITCIGGRCVEGN